MLKMGFLTLVPTLVNGIIKVGEKEGGKYKAMKCIIFKNSIMGETQENYPVIHKSVCCFHYCSISYHLLLVYLSV